VTADAVSSEEDVALAHDVQIAIMRLARRLRAEGVDGRLTLTQIATLATLERHGPMTAGQLAGHERVRPASMTRVIAALAAEGLLIRTPDPSDGRQCLVAISAAGALWLAGRRREREAWLAQRVRALGTDDRVALRAALSVCSALAEG
jgi:DNA-binding MarR family transcriptional regulator